MKLLSVLVGCYGDYPEYSLRCLRSILDRCVDRSAFDLHVGLNQCGPETTRVAREFFDSDKIDSLFESRANINKDPMMRILIERTQTPYILWFDDDSHVLQGWDEPLLKFIQECQPFDAAGHVFFCHRSPEYFRFLQQRPWWRGEEVYLEAADRERVLFPTGGFFLARTAFLRQMNFPDRAMVKHLDDLLLGDCLHQSHGQLINFGDMPEIMDRVRISDGKRRGTGEGADGWLSVDPKTGEAPDAEMASKE